VAVPTLVVIGDHDVTDAKVAAELLTAGIPDAEQQRFPDAAHLPSVEHPERFTSVLRDWLTRHAL
jgi:pimeloyl-ACP methyl ester carboxylesterase